MQYCGHAAPANAQLRIAVECRTVQPTAFTNQSKQLALCNPKKRSIRMAKVKPIPEGYHSVTPYLIVNGAAKAIEFYKKAFGAQELFRMDGPGGKVMHAEIKIGDSPVMLADEFPERGYRAPMAGEPAPVSLMIYVEDVDKVAAQAIAAGIKTERPVEDQFYGDRSGNFIDPFGHRWTVATHKEEVTREELERRMASLAKTA
jgi:PhnB protein